MGIFTPLTAQQEAANRAFVLSYQPDFLRHMYFDTPQRVVDRLAIEMQRTKLTDVDIANKTQIPLEKVQRLITTGRADIHDVIAIFDLFQIRPSTFSRCSHKCNHNSRKHEKCVHPKQRF